MPSKKNEIDLTPLIQRSLFQIATQKPSPPTEITWLKEAIRDLVQENGLLRQTVAILRESLHKTGNGNFLTAQIDNIENSKKICPHCGSKMKIVKGNLECSSCNVYSSITMEKEKKECLPTL